MERSRRKELLQMALIASSLLWIKPLCFWLANTPWWILSFLGSTGLMFGAMSWFLIPFALPIILLGPPLLFFRSHQQTMLPWLVASLLFVPAVVGGECLSFIAWERTLVRFTRRSEPLIRAITAYEAAHGRPPAKLPDLVPDYLGRVPPPSIGGPSGYGYLVGKPALDYSKNPWCLHVRVVSPPLGLPDVLEYFPRRDYPKDSDGVSPRRVGDWAYVRNL